VPRTDPDRPSRPAPEPLDVSAVGFVGTGTALWFLGFLVLLPFRSRLADAGHEVWLWTCLAGGLLGLLGLPLCLRQRNATRRTRATSPRAPTTQQPSTPTEPASPSTRPGQTGA
jgi:hypothetical protein